MCRTISYERLEPPSKNIAIFYMWRLTMVLHSEININIKWTVQILQKSMFRILL